MSECPRTETVGADQHLEKEIKTTNLEQHRNSPNRGEPLPQQVVELKPTVVLAADCVYFEPAFPLLLQTLTDLLALSPPKECTVYFCFKKRRRADMQFLKKAQKMFSVVEVPDQDRPVFSRQNLFLYAITSKEEAIKVTTT